MVDPVPLHEPYLRAEIRLGLERDGVARREVSGRSVAPELWTAIARGVAAELGARIEIRRQGEVVEAVWLGHRPEPEPDRASAFREHERGWRD